MSIWTINDRTGNLVNGENKLCLSVKWSAYTLVNLLKDNYYLYVNNKFSITHKFKFFYKEFCYKKRILTSIYASVRKSRVNK